MGKRIGDFFIEKGVITPEQVGLILEHGRATGARFGDSALQLGFVNREQMIRLFGPNFRIDFFNLDPAYFPKSTLDLLRPEEILELGALPLGVKTESSLFRSTRRLNLGLLDPSRKESAERALELAKGRKGSQIDGAGLDGSKVFLVLADQFIEVLRAVYGVDDARLTSALSSGKADRVLSLFAGGEA